MRSCVVVVAALVTVGTQPAHPQSIVFNRVFPNAGQIGLFIAAADGSQERQLLATPNVDFDPTWSPDAPEPYGELFVMRRDGTSVRQLTDNQWEDGAPAWPPAAVRPGTRGQTASAADRNELIAVTSKDGTRIGVECAGTGPTLLFVHGGVGDRTRWTPMFPLLASRFTACAMDRRGRGASGDSPEYSLSKEAEDVAAVVNSRPGPVFVFGHSYGGVAALEATFLTDRIARLMLYEPPLHEPVGNNLAVAAKVEEMVRKRELERALITFQTEIVKQSPEEITRMKARPTWAGLVASIAVHPRQMRALSAYRFDASRMKAVKMPTLLLIGEDTASPYAKQTIGALRESLPNPTLVVLERQEHNAMEAGRDVLANAIIRFAAPQE